MFLMPENATHADALKVSNFHPSGGRTTGRVAEVIAGGAQPTRKSLPQLVPDGLPEEMHLQAGLSVKHPITLEGGSTEAVNYALLHAPDEIAATLTTRVIVADLVGHLSMLCEAENLDLIGSAHHQVAKVLCAGATKNVVLLRELLFVTGSPDIASPGFLSFGLPMLG